MPTKRKTIAVRPTDSQYELISRLSALTGKSRNAFFQEVLDNSEPALRQMMEVLDQANRYRTPGARVGKVLSVAAREVATVQGLIANELSDLSEGDSDDQAPPPITWGPTPSLNPLLTPSPSSLFPPFSTEQE